MTHLGLRDWEWMIRVAAQPETPEHEHTDPYDEFSDIWQGHAGRGNENSAAQQWLSDRVQYDRPDVAYPEHLRPHDWIGRALEDLPYDVQNHESGRDIDGDHAAFTEALHRGLGNDFSGPGQFNVGGQAEPEPYEPTSEERLSSDEGWLLGPNKAFNWPGGRESIEAIHNGMHQRGFELENEGTDENPSPAYVHRETGSRIRPIVHSEGDIGWQMTGPGGATEHAGPSSAAAMHKQRMDEQAAAETARYQATPHRERHPEEYRDYDTSGRRRSPSGGGGGIRRRESHDYIPKTKAQAMRWGDLFDQAIHGDDGHGREFERASVKSVLNPHRSSTGRLYGVHEDQWDEDHANDSAGRGKVAQAIYHYATPIAWKYHSVQPDGTYDEGTWRYPATNFGSGGWFSTSRVQSFMGPSLWRGGRGAPSYSHTRDPQVSHHTHRALEQAGIHRQNDQSYRVIDNFANEHNLAPSRSGQTFVHTVTSPEGRTFTKRLPVGEASENAYAMTQAPGAGGPTDPVAFLRGKKYRDSQPPPARPRREVPLRLQPELPFRNSSVVSWSDFLRG